MRDKASGTFGGRGLKDWMYLGSRRAKMGLSRLEQTRLAASRIFLMGSRIAGRA